jgi:protein-tyrosine phosphatase
MIKNALREFYWRLYGLGFRNPALPRPLSRIIFICSGNICRSPFAAHVFREQRRDPEATSRGLDADPETTAPAHVMEAASRFDIDLSQHQPRLLRRDEINDGDLLVFVDLIHLRRLCRRHPELRKQSWLLPMIDPRAPAAGEGSRYRIPDPYGTDLERAGARLRRVQRCVVALADNLPQLLASL